MMSTESGRAEAQENTELFPRRQFFYIIIIDDEYLVRRCVGLQLVLALLLAPPHTVVVYIFYVCVTHLYTFRTVCMLKDLFWLQ